MSFNPGEKVLVEAVVLQYIDNDPSAPKPYYQLGLPNGQITIALCDKLHSISTLMAPTVKVVDSKEYKEKHYHEI